MPYNEEVVEGILTACKVLGNRYSRADPTRTHELNPAPVIRRSGKDVRHEGLRGKAPEAPERATLGGRLARVEAVLPCPSCRLLSVGVTPSSFVV